MDLPAWGRALQPPSRVLLPPGINPHPSSPLPQSTPALAAAVSSPCEACGLEEPTCCWAWPGMLGQWRLARNALALTGPLDDELRLRHYLSGSEGLAARLKLEPGSRHGVHYSPRGWCVASHVVTAFALPSM